MSKFGWRRGNPSTFIPVGDVGEATKWLPYARVQLEVMMNSLVAAPTDLQPYRRRTYRPADGVTITLESLHGIPRITIETGGYDYITVGDSFQSALRGVYAGKFGLGKIGKVVDPYTFWGGSFAFGPTGGRVGRSLLYTGNNTFITGPIQGGTCEHSAIITMSGLTPAIKLLPQGSGPYGIESIQTALYGGRTVGPTSAPRYEVYSYTDAPMTVSEASGWVTGPIVIPTYTSTVPVGAVLSVDDGGLVDEGLANPPPSAPMGAGIYDFNLTAGHLVSYVGWEWELVTAYDPELNASVWKPSAAQTVEAAASVGYPIPAYTSVYPAGGTVGLEFYKRWNWRLGLKLDITASTHTNTITDPDTQEVTTTYSVNFRFDFVERIYYITADGLPAAPYSPTFGPEAFADILAIGNPPETEGGDPGPPHSGLSGGAAPLTFILTAPGTSSPPFSPVDGPFEGAGAVWMAAFGGALPDPADPTAYPAFVYWAGDEYFAGDTYVWVNTAFVSDNSAVRLSAGRIAILVITRKGQSFKHVYLGATTIASEVYAAGGSYMNNIVTIVSGDNGLTWAAKITRLPTAEGELLSSLGRLLYIGGDQILAFGSISSGPDVVWRSNDGGRSYSQIAIVPEFFTGTAICLAPGVAGVYVRRTNSSNGYSRFYRTIDSGETWTRYDIPVEVLTNTGNVFDARIAIIRTGLTYATTKIAIVVRLDDVVVEGATIRESRIIISDDGGETWYHDATVSEQATGMDIGPLNTGLPPNPALPDMYVEPPPE